MASKQDKKKVRTSKFVAKAGRNSPGYNPNKRKRAFLARQQDTKSSFNDRDENCYMSHPGKKSKLPLPVLMEVRPGGNQPWAYARIEAIDPRDVYMLKARGEIRPLWMDRRPPPRPRMIAPILEVRTTVAHEPTHEKVEQKATELTFNSIYDL